MLTSDELKNILHQRGLARKDQVLLILATNADEPKSVSEIQRLAVSSGLRTAPKWNISTILTRARGLAIRLDNGWILTPQGREHLVTRNLLPTGSTAFYNVKSDLRRHLASITDPNSKSFLEEAVRCLESNLLRAAVVLSWVGAMSLIYEHVIQIHLAAFNAEAKRRDAKWRDAMNADDLARMKEHDFLDIIESISVIGKNVKQELQTTCLKLRNACGHPNSLKIGENRVAAHIEILILNVFSKF